jgi:transcription elongation GreA/GreB family factor
MRLGSDEGPTADIDSSGTRSIIIDAVARFYGTLHRRLSYRFGRNLHNPEGELQLAEEVVEALSIGEKDLSPAARVAFAHGVYYMEVLSMAPVVESQHYTVVSNDDDMSSQNIEHDVVISHSEEE